MTPYLLQLFDEAQTALTNLKLEVERVGKKRKSAKKK